MINILHIVGARPNYMKTAPIMAEMARHPDIINQHLIHTGQHYDFNMSDVFFDDLALPKPLRFLGVGSGSHAEQTARVMTAFEPVVQELCPDWVFVVGDVNSTLACALVCAKLGIKVAHVEAGLRSFDRSMPEEINRILTDQLADVLYTPSQDGDQNLLREGITPNKICFVGNVMIDSLVRLLPKSQENWERIRRQYELEQFVLVTLHRPSNVDDPVTLRALLEAIAVISADVPVIFPVHPRTKARIDATSTIFNPSVRITEPLGYLDFLALESHARLVITDSGGVQEETTYLGVPCLTVRPNTERPVTITSGTNQLVAPATDALVSAARIALDGDVRTRRTIPERWDGKAAERIVKHILTYQMSMEK